MTRTGYFIYNGFDTRSLGLTVVPGDIDSAPARNFLTHAHGGANGDFVVDTGRFDNVPRTYTVMIRGGFQATYEALCNALLPMKGYRRLTDSWAPDEYFMAYLSGPLEPTVSPDEDMGTVLVSFTRQPQRWLLSGENWELILDTTITNPTQFLVRPTFRIQIKSNLSDTDIARVWIMLFPEINYVEPEIDDHEYIGSLLRNNLGEQLVIDYNAGRAYIEGKPEYDDELAKHITLTQYVDGVGIDAYQYPAMEPGQNTVYTHHSSWGNAAYVRWGWYTV